jgi:hypothetical protein
MKLRLFAGFALVSSFSMVLGCSAGGAGISSKNDPDGDGSGSTSSLGGTQPNLEPTSGSGGSLNVNVGGGTGVKDPNDPRDVPVRQ